MRTLMSGGPRDGERMDWPGFSAEHPPIVLQLLHDAYSPGADDRYSIADYLPGALIMHKPVADYQRVTRGLCGAWLYRFTR